MLGRIGFLFLFGVAVLPAQNAKARTAYEAGMAHQAAGAHADAVSDFTTALTASRDYAAALRARALSYSVLGQEKMALADLDRTLAVKLDDLGSWTLRGQIHMRRGEFEAAAGDFSHVLKQSSDPALRLRRGTAYRGMSRYVEAQADLDLAVSADPANPEAYYQRGLLAAAQEHWADAESDFNRAIERNPDYIPAFLERGAARANAGAYPGAIADLSHYLAHAPNHTRALVTRADAHTKQGNHAAARADLRRAIEADPNDKGATEALARLDAPPPAPTVTASPQEIVAVVAAPVVVSTASTPAPVREAAKVIAEPVAIPTPKAAAPKPTPPGPEKVLTAQQHYENGRELSSHDQFSEALAAFDRAIQLAPRLSQAYNSRGYALIRLRRLRDAVADFNRAIELNSAYKNAYHNRAAARRALGDNAGADTDAAQEASLP